MPYPLFKRLGLSKLSLIDMNVQFVDRSITQPLRMVENVLVNVHDSYCPIDFVVMDIREDNKTPLILSRPYLATVGAIIDVQAGRITFRMGGEKIVLEISSHTLSIIASSTLKFNETHLLK